MKHLHPGKIQTKSNLRRKPYCRPRFYRASRTQELKKDPQSWGRKFGFPVKSVGGNKIKKRSPIMGTKIMEPTLFRRKTPKLKKDPQSWGRKFLYVMAALDVDTKLKKDPQSWGRKFPCG